MFPAATRRRGGAASLDRAEFYDRRPRTRNGRTGRPDGGGDREAQQEPVHVQRGRLAPQRAPGSGHGPAGSAGIRPIVDRRTLRGAHPGGQEGDRGGPPLLGSDGPAVPAVVGSAGWDTLLQVLQRYRDASQSPGPADPPPGSRPTRTPPAGPGGPGVRLHGRPVALPGPAGRLRVRGPEGGRPGVHGRRRGDPGHIRLPGGDRHRQRTAAPGGDEGAGPTWKP